MRRNGPSGCEIVEVGEAGQDDHQKEEEEEEDIYQVE